MKPATAYKDEEGCGRGSAAPLNLRFLGQGIVSLPGSPSGARSSMSDAGSRSSFQGASPGS